MKNDILLRVLEFTIREFQEITIIFSCFPPFRESRSTSDPALPRDRSKALQLHPWCLGSKALRLLQRWGISDDRALKVAEVHPGRPAASRVPVV